jgi:uncharacterized membrane protein
MAAHPDIPLLLFAGLALAGVLLCRLIILFTMGEDRGITEKYCGPGGGTGCSSVLSSKGAMLFKGITLGDIGLVYFLGQLFFLLMSPSGNGPAPAKVILAPSVAAALLFTGWSLFYQARKVRQWCRICLQVCLILWIQGAILAFSFTPSTPSFDALYSYLLAYGLASLWLVVQPVVSRALEVEVKRRQLSSLKKNSRLFIALLKQQPKVNAALWEVEFILGERTSGIQLMAILNPYCPSCATAYEILRRLQETFPDRAAVTVRFPVRDARSNSAHNRAIRHLSDLYFETRDIDQKRAILSDWYEQRSSIVLPVTDKWTPSIQAPLLLRYQQWFTDHPVERTPNLFVNGYQLPSPFRIRDMQALMPGLIKRLPSVTSI